jgi:pimeloyl-ACP methyl ester carboxylesterase
MVRQLAAALSAGDLRDVMRRVRAPALVVHGNLDNYFPLACGVDLAETLPRGDLLVIEGLGHTIPCLMPETARRRIIEGFHTLAGGEETTRGRGSRG